MINLQGRLTKEKRGNSVPDRTGQSVERGHAQALCLINHELLRDDGENRRKIVGGQLHLRVSRPAETV